jgi:hypothetical protein
MKEDREKNKARENNDNNNKQSWRKGKVSLYFI